jgi:RimJ/RimL family protein N-acetyltransferase
VHLSPLEKSHLELVVGWLNDEDNYKWLDFGAGRQILSAPAIAAMRQRELHCLRLFSPSRSEGPVGIVAISDIAANFRSGTLWYVLGDKTAGGKGYTSLATGAMLDLAFGELGLESVNAWAVENNTPSIRVLQKHGFRLIGKQRSCHLVDGMLRGRLLFDLLAEEHRG